MDDRERIAQKVDVSELLTVDQLKVLSYSRWVSLCMKFCEEVGFTIVTSEIQEFPSGVHFGLRLKDHPAVIAYVSNASDRERQVTRQEVRELIEQMETDNIPNGVLFAANRFSSDVWQITDDHSIDLINYNELISKTRLLTGEFRKILREIATRWDFIYPYCHMCGEKMTLTKSSGGKYWKCDNSPNCGMTFTC